MCYSRLVVRLLFLEINVLVLFYFILFYFVLFCFVFVLFCISLFCFVFLLFICLFVIFFFIWLFVLFLNIPTEQYNFAERSETCERRSNRYQLYHLFRSFYAVVISYRSLCMNQASGDCYGYNSTAKQYL